MSKKINIDTDNVRDDTKQLANGLINAQKDGIQKLVSEETVAGDIDDE